MLMSRQPGMLRKHVPLNIDPLNGNLKSGGRYLFDTWENATSYKASVESFAYDGEKFLERPYFLDHECHAWATIGARDFADLRTSHVVLRTERWAVPVDNQRPILKGRWPAIRAAAQARGMTSVWLLYNKQERLVSLVYFVNRLVPKNPATPDFVTLTALEAALPLGPAFGDLPYEKVFDRTQWSLTIWFPFVPGDRGQPSLWSQSPPLPEPYSGRRRLRSEPRGRPREQPVGLFGILRRCCVPGRRERAALPGRLRELSRRLPAGTYRALSRAAPRRTIRRVEVPSPPPLA